MIGVGRESTVSRLRRGLRLTAVAVAVTVLVGCDEEALHEALNLQHDLMDADFTEDDGTFFAGTIEDYRSEVVDGSYRLTDLTGEGPPLETFGFFSRTAYNVVVEADLVALDAPGAAVGVECVHAAGGGNSGERYVFMISTEGSEGFGLGFVESDLGDFQEVAWAPGGPVRPGQRIGLHCDDRGVRGLIDGEQVVAAADPVVDSFKAAALVFSPGAKGDWVEFDNVTAVVPEHGDGKEVGKG